MKAADRVVVTVLTGRRPALLDRTLTSARERLPGLLERAHVHVLLNGNDAPSWSVLDQHDDVIDWVDTTSTLLPIGGAMARIGAMGVIQSGRELWLHLEDDWEAHPAPPSWLDDAVELLDVPMVRQVRLRRSDERVMRRHMVNGDTLRWSTVPGTPHQVTRDAHYTNNPSLVRSEYVTAAWPAAGEREAQRRWLRAGHRGAAQHVPGVWAHIGDADSLRAKTGCPA